MIFIQPIFYYTKSVIYSKNINLMLKCQKYLVWCTATLQSRIIKIHPNAKDGRNENLTFQTTES